MYPNCKGFLLHPNFENFTRTVKVNSANSAILQMVFTESNSDSSGGYLHDFNDGLLVHNHPLFSTDNIALKL